MAVAWQGIQARNAQEEPKLEPLRVRSASWCKGKRTKIEKAVHIQLVTEQHAKQESQQIFDFIRLLQVGVFALVRYRLSRWGRHCLPWPDGMMDVCLLPELLKYVLEWQACLKECSRVP